MKINPLDDTDPRAVRAFLELPLRLYRHIPQWVPPFEMDIRRMLNPRKHPFYKHSEAAFFLAQRDGQVVGRIAVLHTKRGSAGRVPVCLPGYLSRFAAHPRAPFPFRVGHAAAGNAADEVGEYQWRRDYRKVPRPGRHGHPVQRNVSKRDRGRF
jgi:hypothetical protein